MADAPTNALTNNEVVQQGDNEYRRTVQHLPAFYRTDTNQRFLASTLDPLVQKGQLERLDGFIGRQDAYTRQITDRYIGATSRDRFAYQLEPAVTFTDRDTTSVNPEDQVKFTGTYDDYINQIRYLGGKVNNHDRLNKETVYSWNPAVDYDKLVNYREYYWIPEGPGVIEIDSVGPNAVSEYTVTNVGQAAYEFRHRENENNPILTLYRGNTYKFNVNAKGHPFWIMTEPYKSKVSEDGSTSTIYSTGVTNNGADEGVVTFTVPTTGAPDTLYYQCGNHDAMYGILQIKDATVTTAIDPEDDIIGAKNYSLRTLDLSNGMKVKFTNSLVPTAYQDKEYYVEGVGDAITLTDVQDLITPASYATETTILYDSVAYDTRPYALAYYTPDVKDYITIKRDSRDQNAWSRYNRWFHRSVIEETARIGGFTPTLNEDDRAKRPIIEFDSGLALFNHGTVAKRSVTLYDTVTTDAFSEVVNSTGYIVDGIALADGMRVIFAADTDPIVRNKIYNVDFVTAGDSTQKIALTEATDAAPAALDSVFIEFGTVNQGKTFYYDGDAGEWIEAQQKTGVNQQPLFGMWDNDHTPLDDSTKYPNSSFTGATVFKYATSETATTDTVLGIKVKYNTINNVGDIVFESDHTSGTFTYKDGTTTVTKNLAEAHLHYTTGRTTHNSKSAWIKRTEESRQRAIRTFIVDDTEKRLFPIDFYAKSSALTDLTVSVSVNGSRKTLGTDYTLVNGATNRYVRFTDELSVNDQIRIAGYSVADKVADKGIYQVPENLETNPLNTATGTFTYGQILNHVTDIFDKNQDLTGSVPGPSNLRDKPDARLKGGTIHQHEAPLLPAIFQLIDQDANFVTCIDYVNQEYEKWYNSFLTHATGTAYEGVAADRVDEIITSITQGRNNNFPFFYEDMIGWGENVSTRTYTVQGASQTEYAIDSQHSITALSNRAVYVYLNGTQLLLGTDYAFSTTDDSITINATLAEGDKIVIKDYADTTGSYMPVTPTKLGMYPKFKPEIFTDDTYLTNTTVIRRHDGSIIKAYGDERDDLILELEKRIYNNIKVQFDSTLLDIHDVLPSAFTTTDYTLAEVDSVMSPDFYVWAGRNNVQYLNNTTFTEGSPFTYNYANSTDRLTGQKLPGHWRAIYKYFYDTDAPHVRPWEMLGHSEKPSDWEATYGTAPYTSGNDVLWNRIATEPGRYGKPEIRTYLPVDASGNLLDPIAAGLIENFDIPGRQAAWKFGDQAPAETAWRRSSSYPFTVMKTLALTKPAKFFSNLFDPSRLATNTAGNQIYTLTGIRKSLATAKYHLETETDTATGVTIRYQTAGHQPFVVNYLISRNLDPKTFYYDKMKGLTVQLAYKLGGFTDKDNIKVLTDSVSPGSTSGSKFIPDENYKILFRTSNPVESFDYSGILIEKNTDVSQDGSTLLGGYKVLGYSTTKPYFNFNYPVKTTTNKSVSVTGSQAVAQYNAYQEITQTIPYGHVFDTIQDVADFLFGYGHWLEDQGFRFNKFSNELKETLNWANAVREFLFWTTQEWAPGSAVTVSPAADGFELDTNNSIVGKLRNLAGDYSLLDAGGRKIDIKEISTKRIGKTFELSIKSNDIGLYNIALNTVQKEHVLLFDNSTVFADILYDPFTGFRQQRLKLVGWKTAGWNGDYYAPGFMFDAAQVTYWVANTDYKIGDSVEHQGKFYVAQQNHNSGSVFDSKVWVLKAGKPAPQLIPNFDYKISQFNDFYNLETNNFDESQQQLAQRLIGYQSRDYLENLFVNDVSQYKFYQGYIREKGTQNAIDKILKAKYEGEDIDLDLYPEWMIRIGRFGNTDSTESIQITLKDDEITGDPQSIELFDTTNDSVEYARSEYVAKEDLYYKPVEYTASSTFSRLDYTQEGVDRDTAQVYKAAGYPQLTQVQHTAFNITDLFNLDVNAVTANDLIWVANKSNRDWDVFRLTVADFKIATLRTINNASQLEITFTGSHGLSGASPTAEADFFAISNSEETTLNAVYQVSSIPDHKTVVIDYTGNTAFIPTLEDGSTADSYGNIYKFVSVRLSSMDNVNDRLNYYDYNDKDDAIEREGDKVFADADSAGLWRVYEKQDPYTNTLILSPDSETAEQEFGHRIVARNDGRTVIVSAPGKGQGEIHFLFRTTSTAGTTFQSQSVGTMTDNDDNTSRLGESLSISTDENFVVAGAPYTNTIGQDGSTRQIDAGLVKVYIWDPTTFKYGILDTVTPPTDGSSANENLNFGWAHKISEPTTGSSRNTTDKYLFVSAPGHDNDTGRVYMYTWGIGADGSTYDTWTQDYTIEAPAGGSGQRFGHRIAANDNGDILAVSSVAPGNAGKVEIFVRTSQSNDGSTQNSFALSQTITGVDSDGSSINTAFGESIAMSKDGETLIIGAPGVDGTEQPDGGAIYYYKWNADGSTNTYTLQQTISAPDTQDNMKFGTTLDINQSGTRLVIGAEKFANAREIKFDSGETTFDLQDTTIVDSNTESGGAYTATMYNTRFVIDDRLITDSVTENDDFGRGVCVIDNTVLVGAPSDDGNIGADGSSKVNNDGTVSSFDLTVNGEYAWKNLVTETALIDIKKLGQTFEFNRKTKQIRDYYDLYDPVKGRILGVADREINIKTTWDPATYNFGTDSNTKTPWAEDHIGETWWDLSQVKWLWYEQDTQEYKINNWGKTFPGSAIDVYEWTESTLLPSQWNTRSGTQQGAAEGISGVAAYGDDSKYTVVQKYNSRLDRFVNFYYYWVRNKSTVPTNSVITRKNSTGLVSNLITNPQRFDYKYYSVTDTNKLIINGVNGLINDDIVLNVDIRTNDFEGDSHSVWKLAREGDKDYRPGTQIEQRWWDSLIGKNEAGDLVPDVNLPVNERYGNSIRPRQSWYVDRLSALKEIIDYSNSVLSKKQLVGQISLDNLDAKEPEPTAQSGEWDGAVDTYAELTYLNTADLSGTVNYLVRADETANNFWAIYQWDGTEWSRTKLQTYNTSAYWTYTDWYKVDGDMEHSENTRIDKQVTFQYELDSLDLPIGSHVKVTSADTGGWKLFMRTASGWENVGTENGTIRLSTKLYDYTQDATGFAGADNFDDNFFDQEPSTETRKVLQALRDDLFINELAVEYNTLFFTGLRKVLEEQTYVDWMFKTSFVNAKNSVRPLDQRKTYTTGTDAWIESYIDEVKPFHTKLREYKLGYTSTDTQDGIFTDFDNPPFYCPISGKIRSLNVDSSGQCSDTELITQYPWQMWYDYHKKYVQSITVTHGGSGYQATPTVTVLGGTTGSTGPFQIQATSSSGVTSGSFGYYYPLFTSEKQAEIYDSQNGGSGTTNSYTFDGYTGTFYGPTATVSEAQSDKSGTFKMYVTPATTAATATATIQNGEVTQITVTGIGANYTSTPTVVITGGRTDGSTPTDTAKAYANLNNDLVRDFDTTIKFDRVSSTSRVVDWAVSTAYAYNDLIRYNNQLYKVTNAFTSSTDFDDNIGSVYKVYGDETGLTAADRTKGFYTPGSGMPGNELDQVMTGVDYGGTMVTGLLFSQEQGWDRSGWYDFPWDNYGDSRVKAFRADGSTATFTFDTAPATSDVYQVYITADDSTRRKLDDVMRGDGSTTAFTISETPDANALVEFIPFDDDGVLTPTDDRTLDSIVQGGLFGSALGYAPSDIILEGDDFVNPDTSYAPEETVPGQLFDTLDIKVYTSPESGVPFITEKNYRGDGNTTQYAIGDFPGTLGSVTVTVDGVIKKLTTDYTVDVANKTIAFTTAPAALSVISTKVFAISGENYRVLDTFTGDGSTAVFTTSTRGEFNLDSTSSDMYITIDGVPTTAYTTTTTANTITVTFTTAPASGEYIQIAGFNKSATSTRSYASIRNDTITYDGSTNRHTLTYPPGAIGPFSGLTMVEVNGRMLRGPDNTYYLGDGSTYTYGVASGLGDGSTVDPAKTITSAAQVEVYVNGTKKDLNTDYTVDIGNQNIEFVSGAVPTATDVICISTLVDNHYYNEGTDIILKPSAITSPYSLTAGDVISVTTFNNALGMKQRREVLEGRPGGVFALRFAPLNATYTYVWLNGEQLTQQYDYTVSDTTLTIVGKTITASDRIDVMYFALESAAGATGFRIFKDMLNRTFYKRISKSATTKLTIDMTEGTQTITVEDGSVLGTPDIASNTPGVIFVDKERIEYFTKSGNTLGQLRRGTLGTGIKEHGSGTEVVDASGTQTVPYADTVYTNTFTGDGSTATFALSQAPSNAGELDIFIGGQRLLLTSEDGSTINYSVDGSTTAVTLSAAPASGTQIKILHKKGQVWYTGADGNPADGKGLQASTTQPAQFIASEPTNAPE
jgi:hypothetical protein